MPARRIGKINDESIGLNSFCFFVAKKIKQLYQQRQQSWATNLRTPFQLGQ